jgi:hypothetical protein
LFAASLNSSSAMSPVFESRYVQTSPVSRGSSRCPGAGGDHRRTVTQGERQRGHVLRLQGIGELRVAELERSFARFFPAIPPAYEGLPHRVGALTART